MSLRFNRILYDFCLSFSHRHNNRNRIVVSCDSFEANSNDKAVFGYLYTAQINGRCCLCFKISFHEPSSGVMIGTTDIESNMAVWTDAANKETYPPNITDSILIFTTPLINKMDCPLLYLL